MKAKQVNMSDELRERVRVLARVGILEPLNAVRSWTDPAVRSALVELLAVARGFGLAIPLAVSPSGLARILHAGWSDVSKRIQFAIRAFFTGDVDNLLRVPKLDKAAFVKVTRFVQGLTNLARTGRVRAGFEQDCKDMLDMLAERHGGVGSVAWVTILCYDEDDGEVILPSKRRFTNFGAIWKGKDTFWSGQKWPQAKGDSHFEITFES
jgi:hypothetical protein